MDPGPFDAPTAADAPAPKISTAQWTVAGIFVALAVGALAYRLLVVGRLEQTSALFVGVPALLGFVFALTPTPKRLVSVTVKGVTLALFMSGVVLGEGIICIVMAAPLFYLVAIVVALIVERTRRDRGTAMGLALVVILPMSLEGTSETLSFERAEVVTIERTIALSPAEVSHALEHPTLLAPEGLLAAGWPQPQSLVGGGLEVGDRRSIHFAGGEGKPGDLVMEVAVSEPGRVRFRTVRDESHIAHWLTWGVSEARWRAAPEGGSVVQWTLHYERDLDPAWYFGPMERFVVGVAAEHLIASLEATAARSPRSVAGPTPLLATGSAQPLPLR